MGSAADDLGGWGSGVDGSYASVRKRKTKEAQRREAARQQVIKQAVKDTVRPQPPAAPRAGSTAAQHAQAAALRSRTCPCLYVR